MGKEDGKEKEKNNKKRPYGETRPLILRFRAEVKPMQLHYITKIYFIPLEPNPPSPRSDSGNDVTAVKTGVIYGINTN